MHAIMLHMTVKMLDTMHEMKRRDDHGNSANDIENSHDFPPVSALDFQRGQSQPNVPAVSKA